ncbi:MAG: hypothetical protein H7Y38_12580, partial [Armatimonadetes bacterium]|nr:hypothetical protein [Armatimonadota bacterium]
MANEQNPQLVELWGRVVDRVKQTLIAPSVWRALEQTIPVIWEGDTFVVGFGAGQGVSGQLAGYETRIAIEKAVRDATGDQNVVYRLIEGDSLEDWEYTKARDAAAVAGQRQTITRTHAEITAHGTWDEVYEKIARLWTAAEFRGQVTGRARFLTAAMELVEEATRRIYPEVTEKAIELQ